MAWPPQQHQDVTDAVNTLMSGTTTISGDKTFTGSVQVARLGMGNAPTSRQPFKAAVTFAATGASTPGAEDIVGHAHSAVFSGNFSGITGSNAGHVWGTNIFTATGNVAGDANGIGTLYGALVEASVRAPAGTTIGNVNGLMAEAAFFGAQSGASVGNMTSLRVGRPKRKDGATAGSVTGAAYGLFVEAVASADTGAPNAYAMYVDGGLSYFKGTVRLEHNPSAGHMFDAGYGTFRGSNIMLAHPTDTAAEQSARMVVKSTNDADVVAHFKGRGGQTGDIMRAGKNEAIRTRIDFEGRLAMRTPWTPSDAEVANGELMMWVNADVSPPKLMMKMKTAAGVVHNAAWNVE